MWLTSSFIFRCYIQARAGTCHESLNLCSPHSPVPHTRQSLELIVPKCIQPSGHVVWGLITLTFCSFLSMCCSTVTV